MFYTFSLIIAYTHCGSNAEQLNGAGFRVERRIGKVENVIAGDALQFEDDNGIIADA